MQLLVNIDVDDLQRGVRFYAEALGLRLVRHLFDGSVAEMLADQTRIYLLEQQPGTSPAPHIPPGCPLPDASAQISVPLAAWQWS